MNRLLFFKCKYFFHIFSDTDFKETVWKNTDFQNDFEHTRRTIVEDIQIPHNPRFVAKCCSCEQKVSKDLK